VGDGVEISNNKACNIEIDNIENWSSIENRDRFYYDFGDNSHPERVRILLINCGGGLDRTTVS
jgi:hypothetical protein